MWGALSFQWTVLVNNVVPTRVLLFATEDTKGQWLGLVTLVGAVFYMLTGPIAGVIPMPRRGRTPASRCDVSRSQATRRFVPLGFPPCSCYCRPAYGG